MLKKNSKPHGDLSEEGTGTLMVSQSTNVAPKNNTSVMSDITPPKKPDSLPMLKFQDDTPLEQVVANMITAFAITLIKLRLASWISITLPGEGEGYALYLPRKFWVKDEEGVLKWKDPNNAR